MGKADGFMMLVAARYVIRCVLVHGWLSGFQRDRCGYSAASLISSIYLRLYELYCIMRMHGVSVSFWMVACIRADF